MVSLVAIAVSSLGTALATGAGVLLAARLIGSFGRAGVIPAAWVDAVERPSQDQRRRGTSWVVAGAAAAPLIGLPFIVPIEATGVAAMLFSAGVFAGVQSVIMPLILSQQPSDDTGTVQSLNWLALTAGIALGASLGGAFLAAGDLPLVGFGALVLSWLAATILFWSPSEGRITATGCHQS
jgi:predicted MFS family arabinose efflux permease